MKNLRPPSFDSIIAFREIVEGKQGVRRTRLLRLIPQVQVRQRRFLAVTSDIAMVHRCTSLTAAQKADLIHCYEVPTKALDRICAQIKSAQEHILQSQCQYCGVNPLTATFDHYLPKEQFAEFSGFAPNLLPCCRDCNSKKGRVWKHAGRRQVLNLYYDSIPVTRYLSAKILFTNNIPRAEFRFRKGLGKFGGKRRLITAHFKKLELFDVYAKAATIELGEQIDLIGSLKPHLTEGEIAELLRRKSRNLSRQFSPNYWKVALLKGIAASPRCLGMSQ